MKRVWLTILLAAVPVPAGAATRVSSDSACPSADDVSQRLLGLLAAGGPEAASARVRVEGETLRIELAVPGEASHERVVSVSPDCAERAEMAALVIAAWLDAMPAGSLAAPGLPPRERPRLPPPAPAPKAAAEATEPPPFVLGTRTLVGAGLFGSADADGGSGGFALEVAMPNLLADFGWVAEASLALPREWTVGQGTARIFRPTWVLAATGEVTLGKWAARPRAGAALGVLAVSGSGYATNRSATTVTWGGGAGVALSRAFRRGEIWVRLDSLLWPQGRKLKSRVSAAPDFVVALPTWEGRLAAGISWGVH
jgi:hypothetical protein